MRALLLAAGRGERLRPLTDTTPKPLLPAGGRRLIEWQIEALVRAGIRELVVNTAHLAQRIEETLGDGARYGARIAYSREGERAEDALETLGGIVRALPLLGSEPFVVASSDIVTDFDYRELVPHARAIAAGTVDAHLVLVENPSYHASGDMGIKPSSAGVPGEGRSGLATREPGGQRAHPYTYGNIGVLAPALFAGLAPQRARLFPWLYALVARDRVSAQLWQGKWWNVGTVEELHALERHLATPCGGHEHEH